MPPHLFSNSPLPNSIPQDMENALWEINDSKNQYECLEKCYTLMNNKYKGYRIQTYLYLFHIFKSDIDILWQKKWFMHCTNMNYVMKTLLVTSIFFKEDDILLVWTHIWYMSPHQYMKVRVNNKWINIDIWATNYGIEFWDYAHWFQ